MGAGVVSYPKAREEPGYLAFSTILLPRSVTKSNQTLNSTRSCSRRSVNACLLRVLGSGPQHGEGSQEWTVRRPNSPQAAAGVHPDRRARSSGQSTRRRRRAQEGRSPQRPLRLKRGPRPRRQRVERGHDQRDPFRVTFSHPPQLLKSQTPGAARGGLAARVSVFNCGVAFGGRGRV